MFTQNTSFFPHHRDGEECPCTEQLTPHCSSWKTFIGVRSETQRVYSIDLAPEGKEGRPSTVWVWVGECFLHRKRKDTTPVISDRRPVYRKGLLKRFVECRFGTEGVWVLRVNGVRNEDDWIIEIRTGCSSFSPVSVSWIGTVWDDPPS